MIFACSGFWQDAGQGDVASVAGMNSYFLVVIHAGFVCIQLMEHKHNVAHRATRSAAGIGTV